MVALQRLGFRERNVNGRNNKLDPGIQNVNTKKFNAESPFFVQLLLLLSRFSHVRLCATPWTAAYQAPLSM